MFVSFVLHVSVSCAASLTSEQAVILKLTLSLLSNIICVFRSHRALITFSLIYWLATTDMGQIVAIGPDVLSGVNVNLTVSFCGGNTVLMQVR